MNFFTKMLPQRRRISVMLLISIRTVFASSCSSEIDPSAKQDFHAHLSTILGAIFKKFDTCVIQIVDLADKVGSVDFTPSSPLLIDRHVLKKVKGNAEYDFAGIKDSRKSRCKLKGFKMRGYDCIVNVLIVPKEFFFPHITSYEVQGIETLRRQDYTFGAQMPYFLTAAEYPRFFPETMIIYSQHLHQMTEMDQLESEFWKFLWSHLPLRILIAEFDVAAPGGKCKLVVRLVRHRRAPRIEQESVGSSEPALLTVVYEGMATKYAQGSGWLFCREYSCSLQPSNEYCPLTLKDDYCAKEEVSIFGFAIEGQNFTEIDVVSTSDYGMGPSIEKLPIRKLVTSEWITDSYSPNFIPITSATDLSGTVTTVLSRVVPSSLLDPFPLVIWLLVLASVISLAMAIAGLRGCALKTIRILGQSFFTIGRVLVDQPSMPVAGHGNRNTRTICSGAVRSSSAVLCLWGTWILTGCLITNCFKGTFKSNYVFEPVYSGNWTSILNMTDYEIFFAFHSPPVKSRRGPDPLDGIRGVKYLGWSCCEDRYEMYDDDRKSCTLADNFKDYIESVDAKLQTNGDVMAWRKLALNVRLIPFERLRKVISEELARPNTMFLSPSHSFYGDWKHFKHSMRYEGTKFAYNLDNKEDAALTRMEYYRVPTGLHPRDQKVVPRRLKTLVSSGIRALWRKWAIMRSQFESASHKITMEFQEVFLPLSFKTSDIHVVFSLWGLLLGICCIVFGLECMTRPLGCAKLDSYQARTRLDLATGTGV